MKTSNISAGISLGMTLAAFMVLPLPALAQEAAQPFAAPQNASALPAGGSLIPSAQDTLKAQPDLLAQQAAPAAEAVTPPPVAAQPENAAPAAAAPAQAQTQAPAPTLPPINLPVTESAKNESASNAAPVLPPSAANDLPALTTLLEQSGMSEKAAPPGLDLPVNANLPEGTTADDELEKMQKEQEIRQKAFDSAISGILPMKTKEIRTLIERYDETQQAVETPPYNRPKAMSNFMTVSLDPGEEPVTIKTAVGHVTTLTIVDSTGQPWPIQDLSWAGNFEVQQPEQGSHMLRITPMADFAYGNVSMRLLGLNIPVIMTLQTDRRDVQVRVDLQIPERGPNATAPLIQQASITTTAGNSDLTSVLDGVAPQKSNKMKVEGVDGRTSVYESNGMIYVRTPYTLLSPAWDSSVRSADGTNVYSLAFTPVLLLSDKGSMVRAQLSQEDMKDE